MSSKCSNYGCFWTLFTNVINATVLSVDQIGVVPWSLFLWIVWLFLHTLYTKLFQNLLKRICVKEPQKNRLIKIYWSIGFAGITIPFALQNLNLTLCDLQKRFPTFLDTQKWLNKGPLLSVQTKLSYVLLSGFYLNNICETSIERGFRNVEFMIHEFLAIFFITTFPLRCVLFGIAFTTIINVERLVLEFTRLSSTLGVIAKSKFLHIVSYFLLILHTIIWCYLYLNIVPKYFLIKSFSKMKHGGDVQQMSILLASTFSLWAFYVLEVFSSPLSSIIMNHFHGKSNAIENILFKDQVEMLQNGTHCDQEPDFVESRQEVNHKNGDKNKENLLRLYHTVKCVIRMKRKLNRIRSKRNENELNSVQESQNILENQIE